MMMMMKMMESFPPIDSFPLTDLFKSDNNNNILGLSLPNNNYYVENQRKNDMVIRRDKTISIYAETDKSTISKEQNNVIFPSSASALALIPSLISLNISSLFQSCMIWMKNQSCQMIKFSISPFFNSWNIHSPLVNRIFSDISERYSGLNLQMLPQYLASHFPCPLSISIHPSKQYITILLKQKTSTFSCNSSSLYSCLYHFSLLSKQWFGPVTNADLSDINCISYSPIPTLLVLASRSFLLIHTEKLEEKVLSDRSTSTSPFRQSNKNAFVKISNLPFEMSDNPFIQFSQCGRYLALSDHTRRRIWIGNISRLFLDAEMSSNEFGLKHCNNDIDNGVDDRFISLVPFSGLIVEVQWSILPSQSNLILILTSHSLHTYNITNGTIITAKQQFPFITIIGQVTHLSAKWIDNDEVVILSRQKRSLNPSMIMNNLKSNHQRNYTEDQLKEKFFINQLNKFDNDAHKNKKVLTDDTAGDSINEYSENLILSIYSFSSESNRFDPPPPLIISYTSNLSSESIRPILLLSRDQKKLIVSHQSKIWTLLIRKTTKSKMKSLSILGKVIKDVRHINHQQTTTNEEEKEKKREKEEDIDIENKYMEIQEENKTNDNHFESNVNEEEKNKERMRLAEKSLPIWASFVGPTEEDFSVSHSNSSFSSPPLSTFSTGSDENEDLIVVWHDSITFHRMDAKLLSRMQLYF